MFSFLDCFLRVESFTSGSHAATPMEERACLPQLCRSRLYKFSTSADKESMLFYTLHHGFRKSWGHISGLKI
jgi:hypothetical protein